MKFLEKIIILISALFVSCGYYSFSGSTLAGIEKIYLPVFSNNTAEFGLETQLADALTAAVNKQRGMSIVNEADADAVMDGRILSVKDSPLTYTAGEQVSEYKVEISVHIKFDDVNNRKIIMEEDFTAFSEYAYPNGDRNAAIDDALQKIAKDIMDRAMSGW